MKISKALRPNRDLPQLEGINLTSAVVGVGADFEHAIVALPNLAQGAPSGTAGMVAQNTMTVRYVNFVFEAIVTGAITNNIAFNILQRRAGLFLVNTTAPTTIIASTMAVTPASMNNIVPGTRLVLSAGVGAAETVSVLSVTSTSFTATFVNGHSGAYTIVAAPLATLAFGVGIVAAAFNPMQVAATPGNLILPNDVITVQRVTGGTGIASPAMAVSLEWVSSGAQ